MTSLELFFNSDYYPQHPFFLNLVNEHSQYFRIIDNLLLKSVSEESLDSGKTKQDLVKQEAILNCNDKKWSTFLCILGLSSVLGRNIHTYYPDCGEERYKVFLNGLVKPRLPTKEALDDLHILFCYEGRIKPGDTFQPNHFVPLLFYTNQHKRKLSGVQSSSSSKKTKSSSIENIFTASKMPLSQPILNKAHNEAFSSAAAFQVNTSKVLGPAKTLLTAEIVDKVFKVNSCEFDVPLYREKVKGLNTAQISNLIKNVFKPDKQFPFPKTNSRSFRYNWLDLYPWLCYPPLKDGGYCLSCVLFGDRFPGKASKLKNLFSEPFCRWNDASTSFKWHAGHGTGGEMGLHACTFPILTSLLSQVAGYAQPIEIMMDTNLRKEVADNRKKLKPIVDAVTFCGRLGLPLRGHRDDSKYHPEVGGFSTENVGNFVEALNFRVRGGDEVLHEHLTSCGKNQSYISKTSQNKIIRCSGEVIRDQLINEIKESFIQLLLMRLKILHTKSRCL